MITITGKYTNANILTDNVESDAQRQILNLCNHLLFKNNQIVIMPDVHVGKSTVVGLSCQTLINAIPSLLGPDIGCGLLVVKVKGKVLNDYAKLDKVIRSEIPSGANHRKTESKYIYPRLKENIIELCKEYKWEASNYLKAIGTLGGGNHFISLEKGKTGTYLLIHTGSRNLGQEIAIYFGKLALEDNPYAYHGELKQLSYLNKEHTIKYYSAVQMGMTFAENNRYAIAQTILKEMSWKIDESWDIPHNYMDGFYIRKGATNINENKISFIPLNMADGTFMVKGKIFDKTYGYTPYNERNYTLPHGAGRLCSRESAKELLDMKQYKDKMKDIYSTCVNVNTIDESPMAYKPIYIVEEGIKDIVDIIDHLKPVYNYKNS